MSMYTARRDEFCRIAEQRGLALKHIPIVQGQDGCALNLTYTLLGNLQASTCIVILSGVHGIEGGAGSLIQEAILRDFPTPQQLAICLVHAVNPWGMHEMRRVNEINIDLNRNFIGGNSIQRNAGYERARNIICPDWQKLPDKSKLAKALMQWIGQDGLSHVQSVITSGQYHHAEGLFYGGVQPSQSNLAVREIFQTLALQFRDFLVLDIHTGLGEKGQLSIISEGGSGISDKRIFSQATNHTSDKAVSSLLSGTLTGYVDTFFHGRRAEGYVLEVGTYPALDVMIAMQRENWLWRKKIRSGTLYECVREEFKEMFFPSDAHWLMKATDAIFTTLHDAMDTLYVHQSVREV
ncbi:DUF2817 domain-containing protein [Brenneria uluponensis]|uniref:DUF2817 domain-containing protein n=1 Tax=Brenneria uluponensis TaxID=3057057 RepID=UPI0028F13668|nr:DUF2817 domain-containing protein [Brenneria ulupoensis]